jgi:DNA-binding MurR/RpiR family transcriptional regulator
MARARTTQLPIGIVEEVRERMDTLTPSERRVGRALIAAYPAAGLGSMASLAKSAGVTAPTVIRFVRKLGYDGYPDFQRALHAEVQVRMSSPLTLYGTQRVHSREAILEESLQIFTGALERSIRAVPPSEFRAVVRLLADQRRRIVLTGGRFSQLLAHYLFAQLRMLRPDVVLVGDDFDPRVMDLVDVGQGDVVVVFDYRRYQDDTIAFARGADARRAKIVLFTDPWLSPIAAFADHVLTSLPDAPSPFDSMLVAFAMTEIVIAGVVERIGEEGRVRLEEFERVREPVETAAGLAPGRAGRKEEGVERRGRRA